MAHNAGGVPVGAAATIRSSAFPVGARIDRLPAGRTQWGLVFVSQLYWGLVLLVDPVVVSVYPVYWKPLHVMSAGQYGLLVGFSNGLGPLVGNFVFGYLSDRYGRKKAMVASAVMVSAFYWPVGLTTSWPLLMVLTTVGALGVGGAVAVAPAYSTEVAPARSRGRLMLGAQVLGLGLVAFAPAAVGLVLLPRQVGLFVLLFAMAPLVVLVPVILYFVPESPRWLEGKGRQEDAERILRRWERAAARRTELREPDYSRYAVTVTPRVPVFEVFRGRYRRRTVVLLAVWLLEYAGIQYGLLSFRNVYIVDSGWDAHDLFAISLLGGIGTLGILVLGAVVGEAVERKTWMLVSGVMACVGATILFSFPHSYGGQVLAAIVLNIAFYGFVANLYNYTTCAYPTRIRALGDGWTDGIGHLGAVFGPSIAAVLYATQGVPDHLLWFVWFAVVGALVPGVLVALFGFNQKGASLEELSR